MKIITTSKGHEILVDDQDYELLSMMNWHVKGNGYAVMNWGGKMRLQRTMHRLILGVYDTNVIIDHKDRNKLNNTRDNLRICTAKQNARNRKAQIGSTSKYLGVSFFNRDKKWFSHIRINGKSKHLGVFKDEIEAAKCYDKHAAIMYGEFANLNFP